MKTERKVVRLSNDFRCECGRKIHRMDRAGGLFRHARLNHRGDWPTDPRIGGIVICKCGKMHDGLIKL